MSDWVKDDSGLSVRDIERREVYKPIAHKFKSRKRLPWMVCDGCGLLMLKNPLTQWCVRMGCNAEDHPNWPAKLKQVL